MVPGIPRDLKERYAEGNVVLFVGSGASVVAGAPGWRQLLHKLKQEADDQLTQLNDGGELGQLLAGPPSDLILAAGYLKEKLGENLLGERIKRELGALRPTNIHRAIARLHLAGVVTTNYDCLIEDVLPGWTVVLPTSSMSLDQREFIVKLHGSCRPEPHKVVIAPSDYKELLRNQRLVAVMGRLYTNYTFLFVGFGMSDPDTVATLEPLRDVFGETSRLHYALMSEDEIGPIRTGDLKRRLNVTVLPYASPDGSHSEVVTFIDQLADSFVPVTSRRDVDRTLVNIGARSPGERSTRVLVKESSESWRTGFGLPYMSPNMKYTEDVGKVQAWVAREFDLPLDTVRVVPQGSLYETDNKNPSYGDASGLYRFQNFEILLSPQVDGASDVFRQVGGRPARWMTLTEIKAHRATMAVNRAPMDRLGDLYGSDLEDLAVSVILP